MKNDLVNRQKAIDIAYKYRADIIAEEIDDLPAAQPECKRGRWIEDNEGYFYCDKCGKYPAYQITQTNYCPNCGSYNGGKN